MSKLTEALSVLFLSLIVLAVCLSMAIQSYMGWENDKKHFIKRWCPGNHGVAFEDCKKRVFSDNKELEQEASK